jgi:hypothetical protein
MFLARCSVISPAPAWWSHDTQASIGPTGMSFVARGGKEAPYGHDGPAMMSNTVPPLV